LHQCGPLLLGHPSRWNRCACSTLRHS
jgi:hypothetical protein